MKVLKFGGSSLNPPGRLSTVVDIVREAHRSDRVAVVVSALGGVTDALTQAARLGARGEADYGRLCDEIEQRHLDALQQLVAGEERSGLASRITASLDELRDRLRGVSLVGECSPRTLDQILSYGERLSAAIVAGALRHRGTRATDCDARKLIVTDKAFGSAHVELETTYQRLRDHFAAHAELQVVTGFIGASRDGETTTLGRGGSDLTAALLGVALDADVIELWTDVDGVMSADPRLVPGAFPLETLSYEELMELSHFGAKVVYPPTVHPARTHSIPLLVKNTLNPTFPGTAILEKAEPRGHSICGISSINEVALMRLEGDGMVGVPGIAMRLFGALAREGISVILISQASSEHSICFAVLPEAVGSATARVEQEFALERAAGLIDDLIVETDASIIAAVGEEMRQTPGIAGRLFSVLGSIGVNVRAIAQGSSERNISLVIDRNDEASALNAIHDAFFAGHERVHHLFVVGTGRVGGALIGQIQNQAQLLAQNRGWQLNLSGITNSRRMILNRNGIDADGWQGRLNSSEGSARETNLDELLEYVHETPGFRILVDCTASEELPDYYTRYLDTGVAVVTANKRPFTRPLAHVRRLHDLSRTQGRGLYYETTVGAGLPVLATLRKLLDTGDRLLKIEGVFSGTISFILCQLRQGKSFADAVRGAHGEGYTEPDPREDLSGMDVARKLLILAREAGFELELEDVEVESLLPDGELTRVSLEEFWSELPVLDPVYVERQERCAREGQVLCYLARLENGRARVALEGVAPEHPCATLGGQENLFAFYTSRYSETPLVVRGPGAGPEVTAAGVFADILLAIAESTGTRTA